MESLTSACDENFRHPWSLVATNSRTRPIFQAADFSFMSGFGETWSGRLKPGTPPMTWPFWRGTALPWSVWTQTHVSTTQSSLTLSLT